MFDTGKQRATQSRQEVIAREKGHDAVAADAGTGGEIHGPTRGSSVRDRPCGDRPAASSVQRQSAARAAR